MHSALFPRVMRAIGLDDGYGVYLDSLPAATLAMVNAVSLFGLHRRWRGAILGHLAALEMTSTEPNRRYGAGLRRLGYGSDATILYDEHVEADAVHEQIAAVDMCGSLVAEQPALLPDVLFGACRPPRRPGRRTAARRVARWPVVAADAHWHVRFGQRVTAGDRLDYVLPLRWTDDAGLDELTAYVRLLAPRVRVTVVDRSPEPLFSAHAYAFAGPGGTPAEAADVAVRACNVPS